MVSVATGSLTTRVAVRAFFVFLLAAAVLFACVGPAVAWQGSTDGEVTVVSSDPRGSEIAVSIPIWENPFSWPQGHGYVGWGKSYDTPNPEGYLLEPAYGDIPGLAIGLTGDIWYRPGSATWSYTAPGTTRIASADLNLSYRDKLFARQCLAVGLKAADGVDRDLVEHCNPPEPDQQASYDVSLQDPSTEPLAKQAFFRARMPECQVTSDPPCKRYIPSLDLIENGPIARLHKVDMVLVDDDLPVVTPSGPFYDLNGTYIDGRQSYGLTVDASDAGAGIKRTDIDHLNNPQLAKKDADCDPAHHTPALGSRICPPEDRIGMTVDTNPMPEGTRRFDANATDPAENLGHAPWTVIIDRTPPPAPNLRFLKPEEGSAQVDWDESVDPVLPDGTPGSGTTHYRYRSQINGGSWSNWNEIPASRRISNEVYDQPIGTEVRFEVRAIDRVRNISVSAIAFDRVVGAIPEITSTNSDTIDDDFFGPNDLISLSATAFDAETGIRRLAVRAGTEFSHAIEPHCADSGLPFAPRKTNCPRSAEITASFTANDVPEGRYVVAVDAIDRSMNHQSLDFADISVDKTPPAAPSDFQIVPADDEDGEEDGASEISWRAADPNLIDGEEWNAIGLTDT